jgi:uncharacterized protein (TIGR00304 family)
MNKIHSLSLLFFIVGSIVFAFGLARGEVEAGFVVVFPFLIGTGLYASVGFLCVFIAVLLFMFGFITRSTSTYQFDERDDSGFQKKPTVTGGGVVLIGPIPIIFSANWKIAVVLMLSTVILILVALIAMGILQL